MKVHWFLAACCSAPVGLVGCASIDPTEDIGRASSLVTARSGSETGWTLPWFEDAEGWDGASSLSSHTAVRIALQNNRSLRREVETIAASRADFVQAHLLPNPVINVAIGIPTDGMGGQPMAAALVQQLAWLWSRPLAIDGAEAALRARVLDVSDTALDLVAVVRRRHAAVAFRQDAAELQERIVALLGRSVDLHRELFAVGEASRLDLNRVELDLRAAEVRLADRTAALEVARRSLLDALGRSDAPTGWRAEALDRSILDPSIDEDTLIRLAQAQRLDIAAAQARVDGRAAAVSLQTRGQRPDVGVGVGYQQNFSDRPGVFPSISVTPKLFDDNSARIARAESELRQAQIEADRVGQQAVAEVRRAWVELCAQTSVVKSYEMEILNLAQSNLDLAQQAFDAGEADLTVLLESQRRLNDARIELIDRQYAVARLHIEVERAAGGALEPQPMLVEAAP